MQTNYDFKPPKGFAGQIADDGFHDIVSRTVSEDMPFGVLGVKGTTDTNAKLPTSAADVANAIGVSVLDHKAPSAPFQNDAKLLAKDCGGFMRDGRLYVVTETACAPGDDVYARFATGIIDNTKVQKGALRANGDGAAQVATGTPTPANATIYSLSLYRHGELVKRATYTSDADATATEICDGLRASFGTVPGFTFGGTTTIVVTGAAGVPFDVTSDGPGVIAVAATTPSTSSAARVKGAKFKSTAVAGGIAVVQLNML